MKNKFDANQMRQDIATLCDCPWVHPEDIIYLMKELNQICYRQDQLKIKLRIEIEGKRVPVENYGAKKELKDK